jgi:hypothetical protein
MARVPFARRRSTAVAAIPQFYSLINVLLTLVT